MEKNPIILKGEESRAEIFAGQGALVNRFVFRGREILFPQQIFPTDKGLKKRGGIPLLFPNADPITENQSLFNLRRHGFAREMAWEVDETVENKTCLSLKSNQETLSQYPYDFKLNLKVELKGNSLKESLTATNLSSEVMPLAPGFHPYFFVPSQKKPEIKTNLAGFDPKSYVWASAKAFAFQPELILEIPGNGKIRVLASADFKQWTVWSESQRDFVCFEPWVGPRNAILHSNQRINLEPGEKITLSMEIQAEREET